MIDAGADQVRGKPDTTGPLPALYTGVVIRLGYPTQNLTIPASTNRSLRLASLSDAERVRALVGENVADLKTILRWNAEHGAGLFRMGQNLIPFASHPAFPYDWEAEHGEDLREAGELARDLGIRLSMHPGQYIHPGSPKPEVVERSMTELHYVARVFDILGAPDGVAVLHMGGAYADKPESAARFVRSLTSETRVLRYLALENDERVWTVAEVVRDGPRSWYTGDRGRLSPRSEPRRPDAQRRRSTSRCPLGNPGACAPSCTSPARTPRSRPARTPTLWTARDWEMLVEALEGREADVMVEAKGKEYALAPLGVEIR